MWMIVLGVTFVFAAFVAWLASRQHGREADFGSVSHQWVAEHRAQAQESQR
jgi:hypothetical protein